MILGEHDRNIFGEGYIPELAVDVARIIDNQPWPPEDPNGLRIDITLLELAEEVDLSVYTPACLAKESDIATFYGKNVLAYGEITFCILLTLNMNCELL